MSSVTLVRTASPRRGADRAVTASDSEYELVDLLGRGGMATVYLARHRATGRRVALKLVARGELDHLSSRGRVAVQRRLLREARAVGAIQHPNVVEFIDAGVISGCVFIVMEQLDGCSLAEALGDDEHLAWTEVAAIGAMIADGVAAAHAAGIIHRDLKPGNVMLVPREPRVIAKVFDFGIAKLLERAHGLTQPGTALGTPRYMSPEQCRGDEVDHRTDIYSLGVLLYRALAGHCPFEHPDEGELMRMHEEAAVPPLRVDGLPAAFADLVVRCLAKEREDRFASMAEVAAALAAVRPARSSRPLPIIPRASTVAPEPAPVVATTTATVAALPLPLAPATPVEGTPVRRVPAPTAPTERAALRRRWTVRALAGAAVLVVAMLGWTFRPTRSVAWRPPVVAIAPPPAPPPAVAAPEVVEPLDAATVAAMSACWDRVRTKVEGRRKRVRRVRTAMAFVSTCLRDAGPT